MPFFRKDDDSYGTFKRIISEQSCSQEQYGRQSNCFHAVPPFYLLLGIIRIAIIGFSDAHFYMLFGFPQASGRESVSLVYPHCRL